MTYKNLQTTFERELLFQIIQGLRSGKIGHAMARVMAKSFLPTLKSGNEEEFVDNVSKICQVSPLLSSAFISTIQKYEKEKVAMQLEHVRQEIKGGDKNYGN